MHLQRTPDKRHMLMVRALLRTLSRGPGIFLGLMLVIWVVLPLVPEWVVLPLVPERVGSWETGLRFGMGYRAFFTAMLFLGALFFWFLGKERIRHPRGSAGVLVSLAGVLLLTVGLLVTAGVVYPQFPLPQPPEAAAQEATERGEGLFWSGNVGCFRCHAISGTGGTRGPDLSHVASLAGERVPGLTAEQYLLGKVTAGASYQYNVPEYVPMMPQFGKVLTEDQLRDLVAFLLSLE